MALNVIVDPLPSLTLAGDDTHCVMAGLVPVMTWQVG